MLVRLALALATLYAAPASGQDTKPSAVFTGEGARAESVVARPADPPDEDAVRAAITALFDGMRAADTTAIRAAFHPQGRLATATPEGVQVGALGPFLEAVAGAPAGALDERLGPYTVEVDGPLAVAVTPYAFYAGGQFSHCGVNAFTFVRTDGAWQIWSITDTRRRDACPPGADAP